MRFAGGPQDGSPWSMLLLPEPVRIVDARAALALFAGLADEAREVCAFAYLARDHRLLGMRHVPGDRFDRVEVPVRAVVADALAFGAAALLMAHCHPDGDPTPSRADRATTRRLLRALDPLDVRLLDHLVLAPGGSASFRALGWL